MPSKSTVAMIYTKQMKHNLSGWYQIGVEADELFSETRYNRVIQMASKEGLIHAIRSGY
jgi:hypothetical protein